jgi:hypothetical protein
MSDSQPTTHLSTDPPLHVAHKGQFVQGDVQINNVTPRFLLSAAVGLLAGIVTYVLLPSSIDGGGAGQHAGS